jgi:hypothetical protein
VNIARAHIALGALVATVTAGCAAGRARPTQATTSLYVRSDSDRTTIVSPRAAVGAAVGETVALDAEYSVDAWSGASIDIMTAATLTRVHEQRHEVAGGATWQATPTLAFGGRYRYSVEPDYVSHGGIARAALDLARKNTALSLDLFGSRDEVGRAGDPFLVRAQHSLGGRLTLAQVLDARMVGELSLDATLVAGFQASPYRTVAIGGDGTCAGGAPYCLPERVPDQRWRLAPFLRGRRALGDALSLGLAGRFYVDSWGVRSWTVEPDLAWLVAPRATLLLRYRYYTQRDADFYRPRYATLDEVGGWLTRDRKLSAFWAQELGLGYRQAFAVGDDVELELGLQAAVSRTTYLAFVGLDRVDALELTTLLGLRFD